MKLSSFAGKTSRREFLRNASVATVAGFALASPLEAEAQKSGNPHAATPPTESGTGANPTLDASLKFHPDGSVRTFAGNTVICHVPQQCHFRDRAIGLHNALVQSPFAHKLGILPPESYHMTVYSGANDQNRANSSWPGGVPLDASIEQCNRVMEERMKAVKLSCPLPLRVRINVPSTMGYGRASTLRMEGADAASERVLRTVRDQLAEVYRFRAPDHDTYGFHITIAYTMADMSGAEMIAYRAILRQALDQMTASTPVLELGIPEYCTFRDMYRFDTEIMLRST